MKTLIVYSSKYGTVEKISRMLCDKILGKVDLVNINEVNEFELNEYENIIIGGSIYMGRIQKKIKLFCEKNLSLLEKKKLGLFICSMSPEVDSKTKLEGAYSKELLDNALSAVDMGGELLVSKMSFIHKTITKKISQVTDDTSKINTQNIDELASIFNLIM